MNKINRIIAGLLFGATCGVLLAFGTGYVIQWVWPAEHMLQGLAGIIVGYVAVPVLALVFAVRFTLRKNDDDE